MTLYSKDEPFIIGIDFDGTVTTTPAGGNDFPKPQKGFVDFYNHIHEHNYQDPKNPIYMVIHTARNLDNADNWTFPVRYTINSKIPCSCYIDDLNIGTPRIDEFNLDWPKIEEMVFDQINKIKVMWEKA